MHIPYFSNRTQEAIKCQRRYQRHKDQVQRYLAELRTEINTITDVSSVVINEPLTVLKKVIIEKMDPLLVPSFGLIGWGRFTKICQGGHKTR